MIEPADLRAAAEQLREARWALLGDCAVVSRCVHGHGPPGEQAVGVYLGMDAGRSLYGLADAGQVLHVDVLHGPGLCAVEALRWRLREAARCWLGRHGTPGDETHRLLAWVEVRAATADEPLDVPGGPDRGQDGAPAGPGRPSGHVHLALRADRIPLEFLPLAVEAVERAILDSGLPLLPVLAIEPTWESALRPPCACGTGGGTPAAGSASGLRAAPSPFSPAAPVAGSVDGSDPGAMPAPAVPDGVGPDFALGSAERAWPPRTADPVVALFPAGPPGSPAPRPAKPQPFRRPTLASPRRGAAAAAARAPERGAPRPSRLHVPYGHRGLLLPVESVVQAVRAGSPVRPRAVHLRYGAPRARRHGDVLLAVDRSPSMAGRLEEVRGLAETLRRAGHAVGLYVLPLDGQAGGGPAVGPTRDRRVLAAALERICDGTDPGGSDLAEGFRALAAYLRDLPRPRGRVLLCWVVTDGLATGPGDPFAAALDAAHELRGIPGTHFCFCGWQAGHGRLRALADAAGARWLTLGP